MAKTSSYNLFWCYVHSLDRNLFIEHIYEVVTLEGLAIINACGRGRKAGACIATIQEQSQIENNKLMQDLGLIVICSTTERSRGLLIYIRMC